MELSKGRAELEVMQGERDKFETQSQQQERYGLNHDSPYPILHNGQICLENSVDSGQTAPLGAVWSESSLFANPLHIYGKF